MVGRIRGNAEALGLRLADEQVCEPNLIVTFVADGQGFFQRMRAERAYLFRDMTQAERDELLGAGHPVRTLLRVIPRSRDGMPISRREDLVSPPRTTMWMAHSKIYSATRNDIYHALVVFDRGAIEGMSINQLADYATFRALSRTLPRADAAADGSILALFSDGTRADGLTGSDRAWLAALYRGPPNMPAPARLAELEKASGRRAAARE